MLNDFPKLRCIAFCLAVAGAGAAAQQVDPPAPRADLSEANALVSAGDFSAAEALLATLQADHPDDPRLLLQRGELLVALSRAGEAVGLLRRVIELDPEQPRAHFQLGTALAGIGESDPAIEAYGRAREMTEDDEMRALAGLNRSMLFQRGGRLVEAAGELEHVLIVAPGRTEIFGDLATLYVEAGRPEQAAVVLGRGSEAGFLSALHCYSVGAALYTKERFEDSRAMLDQALRIDPGLARAERSLAAALEKLGREQEALEHLRRYLELAPDSPDAAEVAERLNAPGDH